MIDTSQAESIIGQELRTSDGTKIGKIGQLYVDDYHGQPEWVTVNTGLFGTSESFVPLAQATLTGDGVTVPYTKDQIKDAPNVEDSGHITEADEQQLYQHYDIPYTTEGSTFADTSQLGQTAQGQATQTDAEGAVGRDTSGPVTDDAMTRSEERLHVGTEQVQTGKARLRKYIVTENVTQTVPVSHEEVRIEREPITAENMPDALDGPALSEEEHEVTLTEERVVTSKETVPVERVRLDKDTVTEQQQVDETISKEQIDVDGDAAVTETKRN